MSPGTPSRALRAFECITLFIAAPTILALFLPSRLIIPAIWMLGAISLTLLLLDRTFDRRELVRFPSRGQWKPMLLRFTVCSIALALILALFEPHRLLELPRNRPGLWGIIMVAYPVLSVLPQELAFRSLFHHRYAQLFPTERQLIGASALAFGFAHIIMHNAWAVAFCTVGGIIFGRTYARTRSLPGVCIEHALYGCFIFTIGWGWYFYGGNSGR